MRHNKDSNQGGVAKIFGNPSLVVFRFAVLLFTCQQWRLTVGKGMLVVGNPTISKNSSVIGEPTLPLAPLPGAEQEAIEIASLLNTKAIIPI